MPTKKINCDFYGSYEVFLSGDDMPQGECFVSRDMLMKSYDDISVIPKN